MRIIFSPNVNNNIYNIKTFNRTARNKKSNDVIKISGLVARDTINSIVTLNRKYTWHTDWVTET